jgi:hypothetical protein
MVYSLVIPEFPAGRAVWERLKAREFAEGALASDLNEKSLLMEIIGGRV